MKILGLNSTVEVKGVPAKVTGIATHNITLKGQEDTVQVSLQKVNKMIDEKTLKILQKNSIWVLVVSDIYTILV